jgi:hypothetical protein
MTKEEEWDWQAFVSEPYEVYHPDSEDGTAKCKTWEEALAKQKEWNKECPGHVARRRKDHPTWRKALSADATTEHRSDE